MGVRGVDGTDLNVQRTSRGSETLKKFWNRKKMKERMSLMDFGVGDDWIERGEKKGERDERR